MPLFGYVGVGCSVVLRCGVKMAALTHAPVIAVAKAKLFPRTSFPSRERRWRIVNSLDKYLFKPLVWTCAEAQGWRALDLCEEGHCFCYSRRLGVDGLLQQTLIIFKFPCSWLALQNFPSASLFGAMPRRLPTRHRFEFRFLEIQCFL